MKKEDILYRYVNDGIDNALEDIYDNEETFEDDLESVLQRITTENGVVLLRTGTFDDIDYVLAENELHMNGEQKKRVMEKIWKDFDFAPYNDFILEQIHKELDKE